MILYLTRGERSETTLEECPAFEFIHKILKGVPFWTIFEGQYLKDNIWRAIFEGQYLKDNIWRTIFEEQYLKDNIWRSYLNNMWTIEFFLKDNIWEGQYFNIILDTGDTPIFFRFFSKNLEIFQKNFYTPRFYFFDFLSKNLKFRNFLATPKKNFWPPKKI